MRKLDTIIVHCSFTKPNQDIGSKEIREWHLERGWSDIGYHYVIRRDGGVEIGRDIRRPGAHARGHNSRSIGICLVGGMSPSGDPVANYTDDQMDSLFFVIGILIETINPMRVIGHNEVSKKPCPCFNVSEWFNIGR